jgi:uncharacterized membrane protein YphA (DoxX/SURF4 family)
VNVVLWVLAGILAAAFLFAGLGKVTQPKEKLATQSNMAWTEDFAQGPIRLIGVAEILAAVALIVPPLVGVATWLTPLAALGLVALMLGAAITHLRRGETQNVVVNVVILVLAAVVAWGRFGPYAF